MYIQLVEPGMTPDLHVDEIAIGIDFGTTHCVLAVADNNGVTVLKNSAGQALIPSTITYSGESFSVGSPQEDSIISIKRLIGRKEIPESLSQKFEHLVVANATPLQLKCDTNPKSITAIAADIFTYLKAMAENSLSKAVSQAVITVPAYYDEAARQQTKIAAELAGFKVLRLINEPTAAALSYGLDQQTEGTYVVYDLGGGTFDVSILKLSKGVFQVIATAGDTLLGGDDIDKIIIQHLLPQGEITNDLLYKARYLKEKLSTSNSASLKYDDGELSLTQEQLHILAKPLIERTLDICTQALSDAKLSPEQIEGVILVGGATRMPSVYQAVASFFNKSPLTNLNPDEIVARGAALQAKALTRGSDTLLMDVTPLSLGIEIMGDIVEKIIPRNTPIPVSIAQDFTTYEDGQTMMKFHILQGEREFVSDCRSLGDFILSDIPPMVAGAARIRVTFSLDVDGLLSVTATEQTTERSQHIEIKTDFGLTDEEMLTMLHAGWQHGQSDMTKRLLVETQVEARQLIDMIRHAISQDGNLLERQEADLIIQGCHNLENLVQSDDREAIQKALKELEKQCQPFAERRMNISIQRALTGQKVNQIK